MPDRCVHPPQQGTPLPGAFGIPREDVAVREPAAEPAEVAWAGSLVRDSGRGLRIVSRPARQWGTGRSAQGRTVWWEQALTPGHPAAGTRGRPTLRCDHDVGSGEYV